MHQRPPTWIQRFFLLSSGLALLATLGVLFSGSDRSFHDAGPIADLTFNLSGQQVREHCTTCHRQGGRPDPANLDRIVKPHPDIEPHLPDKLGCTGCHLGEGMALDLKISHGLPGHGAKRVLAGNDTRASCYRCHRLAPLAGAEPAWQGYQLFVARGCSSCHRVAGLGRGGYFGPDLSDIGSLLGLDQIQEAIRDPQLDPANSIMPRFPLSKSQSRQLAYFLKSRINSPAYATPMQVQAGAIRLPEINLVPEGQKLSPGEQLLYRGQCLACHQFRDQDGRIAPDLTHIGQLRDRSYLRQFLDNPTDLIPDARMPRIILTASENQQLLDFLAGEATGPITTAMAMPDGAGLAASAGKTLYMQLCQRCHAAEGDGHGPIQPNLANFPRRFSQNADYFRSRTPQQILDGVSKGIPGTSMPPYGNLLDRQQIDQVLQLIFDAFIGIGREEHQQRKPLPHRPQNLLSLQEQDALFAENCARCHGSSGTGKGPEARDHLPRPRNLHNHTYFAALDDTAIARDIADGVPGTAMPAFAGQLSGLQLWSLVDRVRRFSAISEREGHAP
jgi:mono/diheme cytochrome c family protein